MSNRKHRAAPSVRRFVNHSRRDKLPPLYHTSQITIKTEDEIAEMLRNDDMQAAHYMFLQYYHPVYDKIANNFVSIFFMQDHNLHDCMHASLERLCRMIQDGNMRHVDKPFTYFLSMCRNQYRDFLRAKWGRDGNKRDPISLEMMETNIDNDEELNIPHDTSTPQTEFDEYHREQFLILRKALATLPQQDRVALYAYYYMGYSQDEIFRLGMVKTKSRDNMKHVMNRARVRLREAYDEIARNEVFEYAAS